MGIALLVALCAGGCAEGADRRPGSDAGIDAGRTDAGLDAGRTDAGGFDAGGVDAGGTDGGTDGGMDAGPGDAGRDGGMDAGRDAGMDAGRDAGIDAGRDAGSACPPTMTNLAIIEVMIASVSGSTDRGEWFEIVNSGSCTIDLTGVIIQSPTSTGLRRTHAITGASIMAGQRLVLAQSGDPVENHGLAHDYVYGTGGADEVVMNNGNDELTLELGDGTVLDRVAWPSTGFTRGASRQLPADVPTAMNDDWALWCDATRVYSMMGGTFLGSPQSANDASCP